MEHSGSPTEPEPPPSPMEGRAAGDCSTGIAKTPPLDEEQPILPSTTSPPPNTTKDVAEEVTPLVKNEL